MSPDNTKEYQSLQLTPGETLLQEFGDRIPGHTEYLLRSVAHAFDERMDSVGNPYEQYLLRDYSAKRDRELSQLEKASWLSDEAPWTSKQLADSFNDMPPMILENVSNAVHHKLGMTRSKNTKESDIIDGCVVEMVGELRNIAAQQAKDRTHEWIERKKHTPLLEPEAQTTVEETANNERTEYRQQLFAAMSETVYELNDLLEPKSGRKLLGRRAIKDTLGDINSYNKIHETLQRLEVATREPYRTKIPKILEGQLAEQIQNTKTELLQIITFLRDKFVGELISEDVIDAVVQMADRIFQERGFGSFTQREQKRSHASGQDETRSMTPLLREKFDPEVKETVEQRILQLQKEGRTEEDIVKRLQREYHPDKNLGSKHATELFKYVQVRFGLNHKNST